MKPEVSETLGILAQTVILEIAPQLQADYAQRNAQLIAMLLTAAAEEFDRAAERRLVENRALRELFRSALPAVRNRGLRARLEAAAGSEDPDLRVGALGAANDELRALLIDLHAHVEELDSDDARRVEAQIWSELGASTQRRALSIAPF